MKTIQRSAASWYVGIALAAYFDCYIWNWKFWAFVIPLSFLEAWKAMGLRGEGIR